MSKEEKGPFEHFEHFTSFSLSAAGAHVAEAALFDLVDWVNITSCETGESYLVLTYAEVITPTLGMVLDSLNQTGFIGEWLMPNNGAVVTYRRASYPKTTPLTKEQELALAERAGSTIN